MDQSKLLADLEEIAAGGDLEGIQALLLQEKVLKKLKEQQEQMQALKGRQAALLAIQRDAEQKLAEARNWGNEAARGAQNIPVEIPVEIQNSGRQESGTELNVRRNYLRNEFKEQNSADRSKEFIAAQAPVDPIIDQLPTEFSPEIHAEAAEAYEQPPKRNEEQKQTLTLFELLDKEDNKDSDDFEEAHQDLVHMFTCHAVLRSSFPQAHVTVNIDKAEDVPENARDRPLYRYLRNLKPETCDSHYSDIWGEYGTLLMAENLLDLARSAKGPDQNLYVVVRKTQFYEMQSELQLKTQEVEELSTRLSRLKSKDH